MVPTNVFAFTPIAGFEIVLFEGICADQSNSDAQGFCDCPCCLPSHVRPIERLFGHACVHVAMIAVVATIHHRLGHAVPIHGIESVHVHVHRVDIVGWGWHQVHTHVHASLHC